MNKTWGVLAVVALIFPFVAVGAKIAETESIVTVIVYVAMSDGGQPPFDFAGMSVKFATEAAIGWAVAAVLLAIASVFAPRFSPAR